MSVLSKVKQFFLGGKDGFTIIEAMRMMQVILLLLFAAWFIAKITGN